MTLEVDVDAHAGASVVEGLEGDIDQGADRAIDVVHGPADGLVHLGNDRSGCPVGDADASGHCAVRPNGKGAGHLHGGDDALVPLVEQDGAVTYANTSPVDRSITMLVVVVGLLRVRYRPAGWSAGRWAPLNW